MSGCKKEPLEPGYSGKPAVGIAGTLIQNSTGDSALISFGTRAASVTDSTVYIAARITGDASTGERTFSVVVVDSLSTAAKDEFVLPTRFVIPANSINASFPVVLKRSARLAGQNVRIVLAVKDTEEFLKGPTSGRFSPVFKLIWNDQLVKPANWPGTFGAYSATKFRIIIQQTGYTDFTNMHVSVMYQVLFAAQDYVLKYNDDHPGAPLRDENGSLVSFP
jgi:hypothetical protein